MHISNAGDITSGNLCDRLLERGVTSFVLGGMVESSVNGNNMSGYKRGINTGYLEKAWANQ